MPSAERLAELKLSAEVAWYLLARGWGLPTDDQVPYYKTPEPGEVDPDALFDPARVDRLINTFMHLNHTKGKWAGRPLRPDVWQVAYIFAPVFGWVRDEPEAETFDGRVRVCRELYVDVSRKNGKSTIVGGTALYMTCADGEAGAEGVTAATTSRQAGYVFDPIRALVRSSPFLKGYAKATKGLIQHLGTGSTFMPVSSIAEGLHGANLHCGCVDELHVHKSSDLVEAIETGTGSRSQPLIVFISTADDGQQDTIYARKRGRIEQLAKRLFVDPATYGVVWAAAESEQDLIDRGIDPFSERAHRLANPGYGVSPTRQYLRQVATRAAQSPADYGTYLRLHLGIRTKQKTTYIKVPSWDACGGLVAPEKLAAGTGRYGYGGLDLANTSDFTCWCMLFPDGEGGFDALYRLWIPERAYEQLVIRTSKTAEQWRREGRFVVTDGDIVDDEKIVEDITADLGAYKIKDIGYDPWNSSSITNALTKGGAKLSPVQQTISRLSPATKELQRVVHGSTPDNSMFRHGGNPVVRWMVGNLAVYTDTNDNVKPDRKRSSDKIDAVPATVIAMSRAMTEPPRRRSAYSDGRGLAVSQR